MANIIKARAELHELADIMDRRKSLAPFAATLRDVVEKHMYRKNNNPAMKKAVRGVRKAPAKKKSKR